MVFSRLRVRPRRRACYFNLQILLVKHFLTSLFVGLFQDIQHEYIYFFFMLLYFIFSQFLFTLFLNFIQCSRFLVRIYSFLDQSRDSFLAQFARNFRFVGVYPQSPLFKLRCLIKSNMSLEQIPVSVGPIPRFCSRFESIVTLTRRPNVVRHYLVLQSGL